MTRLGSNTGVSTGPGLVLGRELALPVVLDLFRHGREGRDLGAVAELHDPDAGGGPSLARDAVHALAGRNPIVRDHEHLVSGLDHDGSDDVPSGFGQLGGDDSFAPSPLAGEVLQLRALAEAELGDDEQVIALVSDHVGRDDLRVLVEANTDHTGCRTPHGTYVSLAEPDRLALARDEKDILFPGGGYDAPDFVVVFEVQSDDALASGRVVLAEQSLLDHALSGCDQ